MSYCNYKNFAQKTFINLCIYIKIASYNRNTEKIMLEDVQIYV